jgi:hypothetical protein
MELLCIMPTRTIAIGDIHGCSAALDALLDTIRPRPKDTIVTLGDYINRGPDSRGVLDRLIELSHQCRLIPLLGNHDQMLLEARSGRHPTTWIGMGGLATLDPYGPGRDLDLIPDEHFEFLEAESLRLIASGESFRLPHRAKRQLRRFGQEKPKRREASVLAGCEDAQENQMIPD